MRFIETLAVATVDGYRRYPDLDALVKPIYGCPVHRMDRGQASMLIDDLLYQLGTLDEFPDYPSIFGDRLARPRPGAGR